MDAGYFPRTHIEGAVNGTVRSAVRGGGLYDINQIPSRYHPCPGPDAVVTYFNEMLRQYAKSKDAETLEQARNFAISSATNGLALEKDALKREEYEKAILTVKTLYRDALGLPE